QLFGQALRVPLEKNPIIPQHFGIEWSAQRDDAIPVAQRLEQRWVRSSHAVSMEVRVRVAVQFFYVLRVVEVPKESDARVAGLLEAIHECAAIVCAAGNGQEAVGACPLKGLHNQARVVL